MKRSTDKFEVVERKIVSDRCVVLDVATATKLPPLGANRSTGAAVGGTDELVSSPGYVLSVHRRYAEADYDVISTNTQGLPTHSALARTLGGYESVHWMDLARRGIGLARRAVSDAGRTDECAVAFIPSGDIDTPEGQGTWTSVAASAF